MNQLKLKVAAGLGFCLKTLGTTVYVSFLISLPFLPSRICLHFLTHCFLPSSKLTVAIHVFLMIPSLVLPLLIKDPYDYTGPIQISPLKSDD